MRRRRCGRRWKRASAHDDGERGEKAAAPRSDAKTAVAKLFDAAAEAEEAQVRVQGGVAVESEEQAA